tara:strand:+ start:78 stop:446 length:369 start_codon:yes stop_codon:yes gene_type:complete
MRIYADAFNKLISAHPTVMQTDIMAETYIESWKKLSPATVSRTVDWFVANWARFPSLEEFNDQAKLERGLQNRNAKKQQMDSCLKCDRGFISVDLENDTFRPCEECLPDTFENWATGQYAPG